jgi:dipicolinate synthase subunit B
MADTLKGLKIGYALTGSFCTFERSFEQAAALVGMGAELIPIMSETASTLSTRFGTSDENADRLREICGKDVITNISMAEPIGPKDMTDLMIVAPCTSNTAAKLANGITDSTVVH